jgi:hypothetical protein
MLCPRHMKKDVDTDVYRNYLNLLFFFQKLPLIICADYTSAFVFKILISSSTVIFMGESNCYKIITKYIYIYIIWDE